MERFIKNPNLPKGRVSTLVIGSGWNEIARAIRALEINVVELPENSSVSKPVRGHADMAAYYCGDGKIILCKGTYCKRASVEFPGDCVLRAAINEQGERYPRDVNLNACELGQVLLCAQNFTDPAILLHAHECGKIIADTKQGYTKCSVCVLDEKHIITADDSITAAARRAKIDVLKISPGFFQLPGYEYGFIGGASFKIAEDTIAFTGSLHGHPNEREILEYINALGIQPVYLTEGKCVDIGSAIALREEV